MTRFKQTATAAAFGLVAVSLGCATFSGYTDPYETKRDKTKKGAIIGAGAGAVLGAVLGEGDADEILAGAAIGAGIGAGVGAYMDKQEEKLAKIPGTTVERVDEDKLLLKFDSDVLFAVDSADLNSASRASVDRVANVLKEYGKTAIIVQGHTDSTGSDQHNLGLSERRADAVRGELASLGIPGERMASTGYGEAHPVADNGTADGRRLNRRVDLLIKAKAK